MNIYKYIYILLVGGWTNPFEKYDRRIVKLDHFRSVRGENQNIWNHHLVYVYRH